MHETLDKIGIFSLSESPKHPLLWSHYAGGHRGVCIEFDASMGLFQSARLVAYTDQAPVINRLQESTSEIIDKSMLTKGDVWAYEEEWRVIARWRDENRIHRYLEQHNIQGDSRVFIEDQHGPGHYSFPPDAIRCIILGSSIGAEDESWLHTIIDRSSREIPIKQASMARNGIVTIDGL